MISIINFSTFEELFILLSFLYEMSIHSINLE